MSTRRQFLRRGAAAALCFGTGARSENAPNDFLDVAKLPRYVDPLPRMKKAAPVAGKNSNGIRYRIAMREFLAKVHRDMPPTTMWGYDGACPGPTIEVQKDQAVSIEWINQLPARHLFTVDHSLHGAEADKPAVRAVVHLHGARVAPDSDGYPEHWITSGQSQKCQYPNAQAATALYYHDHAMGITRLNTAAGLMGLYLIRDESEDQLNLPAGRFEIPLVIMDRSFRTNGQLLYPVSDMPGMPWVSEYYGAGILVNGKLFPYLDVQPRRYRFRVLNSSNGSFYPLSLALDTSFLSPDLPYLQIGSDQGLLSAPESVENVILGPGERIDLLVDFAPYVGKQLYFRTKHAYFMQFRVSNEKISDNSLVPSTLRKVERLSESAAVQTRPLTLLDDQDRLERSHRMLLNGMHWAMPVTEKPVLDSTEIWSFINLTDDSHPIHLHMVQFQVLDRTPFDLQTYFLTKKVVHTGPALKLEPNELGWKDTVRVDPLTVTRIIVRFSSYTGRYVWHCHMLEHEDNEMMRPYEIVEA
jgi:spore coat protein A